MLVSEVGVLDAQCYALLFADKIIQENNGKKGLIGVFSNFNFPKFPAGVPQWFIFIAITNLIGEHTFSMNLVHDDDQLVILPMGGDLKIPEESPGTEIVIPVQGLSFPKEGDYVLTFNIDGQQIANRTLPVKLVKQEGSH